MGTITDHFSYSEFEASDTAKAFHIDNHITSFVVRDAIKALVDEVLEPLRQAWGKPLHVNSGYRCPALNRHPKVGGSPTSQHVKGEAADIACSQPLQLAKLAKILNLPYDQMIVYPTFVHFSHRLKGPQRKQVLYNKSYKGPKTV